MAEGIRIRQTTGIKNAIVAVKDITVPFTPRPATHSEVAAAAVVLGVPTGGTMALWSACATCGLPPTPADHPMGHQGFKTRHIHVDADGTAIVSAGVWAGLSRLFDKGGFELVNTVPTPPAITLAMGGKGGGKRIVHHKTQRPINTEEKS